MKAKSVKSVHPCKSVVQTIYDIVKAHGGEIKVESLFAEAAGQAGTEVQGSIFTLQIPLM